MENACRDTLLCKEGENLIAGLPGRSEPDARTVSVIAMLLGDDLVREYGNSAKAGRKLRNCRNSAGVTCSCVMTGKTSTATA